MEGQVGPRRIMDGVSNKSIASIFSETIQASGVNPTRMPEIIVYEHENWKGAEWRTNFGYRYVGDDWNDKITCILVISGTWEFWEHAEFQGDHITLSPGYYHNIAHHTGNEFWNDRISSFRPISL
jgi:hypothetical protein